jgi:L,D-peptidoglycan transpeptidase YkuD (ErfK/YbiS/YcfS/YnhG family)
MVECALGRSGIGHKTAEGDGITPIGLWPLRCVLFRPDRVQRPETHLSTSTITRQDGWCDTPDDPNYNRQVKLPYPAGHERLWRQDNLYDVVVVIGFNDDPVVSGAGSAIFLHIATPDYSATEGCVAIHLQDMLHMLKDCNPATVIEIQNSV